jgi:RNA polymerase sigma-70 factor (ECF subfamily)
MGLQIAENLSSRSQIFASTTNARQAPMHLQANTRRRTVKRDSERIFDEYLAAAAATGDREALARLVARVLGDGERARDAVQEAWIEIIRGLGRLDDVVAFPAWAFRIVTRRCQRMFQRAARDRRDAEAMAVEDDAPAPGHESAEFAAELALVQEAMATLPAGQRAALALFYLEDLSVAEIAVALDVPPGTVKTRLMHARRKVRDILEGEANEQG